MKLGEIYMSDLRLGPTQIKEVWRGVVKIWPNINIDAPVITSNEPDVMVELTQFNYQITATNNPTLFNATGLPQGLSINTGTGVISGQLPSFGEYPITVKAINAGGEGSKEIKIRTVQQLVGSGVHYSQLESGICGSNRIAMQIVSNANPIGSSTIFYDNTGEELIKAASGYYKLIGQPPYYYFDGDESVTHEGNCIE